MPQPWWRGAVFYQVYVRSFADADGDGVGDLPGITSRLEYIRDLGVDAIWLTPFYPSPQKDHGYDVADYYGVHPEYGTLKDVDRLLARAHELRLKVLLDIVPNHTSDQHRWFQSALASPRSRLRKRYHFADGKENGSPPNNWTSSFSGPAWLDIVADVARLAPTARILNYTNPMSILTLAAIRKVDMPVVGLCHSVQGTSRQIAGYLDIPYDEMKWECAGINHNAWFTRLEHKAQDMYPRLRERAQQKEVYEKDPVRFEMMLHLGAFVTESSGHFSEYVPYFRKRPDLLQKYITDLS